MEAPEIAKSDRFYVPELDGLRFFAFLWVFVTHSTPHHPHQWTPVLGVGGIRDIFAWTLATFSAAGGMGVEVFFVLSSYLITALLVRERQACGQVHVPAFWLRRILRIWPLYFVVIAVSALLASADLLGQQLSPAYIVTFLAFSGNWAMYYWGSPQSVALILWSVSVEEQFYATWPLLIRRANRTHLVALCLVLVIVACVARTALWGWGITGEKQGLNTLSRLDAIGMGALLAVAIGRPRQQPRAAVFGYALAGLGLIACVARATVAPEGMAGLITGAMPLSAVGSACLVAVPLVTMAGRGFLRHRGLVYLGKISYGLYALHTLVLATVVALPIPKSGLGYPLRLGLALLGTVGLASLSYFLLERPFLRLKDRFTFVRSR